jgi:hypothetical protein
MRHYGLSCFACVRVYSHFSLRNEASILVLCCASVASLLFFSIAKGKVAKRKCRPLSNGSACQKDSLTLLLWGILFSGPQVVRAMIELWPLSSVWLTRAHACHAEERSIFARDVLYCGYRSFVPQDDNNFKQNPVFLAEKRSVYARAIAHI